MFLKKMQEEGILALSGMSSQGRPLRLRFRLTQPRKRGKEFFKQIGKRAKKLLAHMAGGLGFEPRLVESESTVLPLDDPPSTETP